MAGITKDELRIIRSYLPPYLPRLTLITVLSIICAFFEAVSLGALVPLLQLMERQPDPGGTLWGFLKGFYQAIGVNLTLINLLVLLAFLFLLGQIILYAKKALQVNLRVRFVADLKKRFFNEVLHADIAFHNLQKPGSYLNVLITEADSAGYGLFAALELLTDLFFIAVYTAMLLYISVELTLLSIGIALMSFSLLNFVLRRSTVYGRALVEWNTIQNEFLSERFNLLRLIKTSSTERRESDRFSRICDEYQNAHAHYGVNGISVEVIFQSVIFILAVVVLAVSLEIFHVPLAMLLVFLFILVRITGPLRDFNSRRHELARDIPSLRKYHQLLTAALEGQKLRNGTRPFSGFQQEITLDQIDFSYPEGPPVITDLTIGIRKREMVALVGPSGGGKSTIADLIIRLVDPDRGAIRIDGIDLRKFDLESYHTHLGVVSQDIFIWNDTVLHNICYGGNSVSEKGAIEAARIANAHDFIRELPQGYNTMLGERGVNLSGGQRQRIALARAIYKRPEILILDEATSSLDSESEQTIQRSISEIRKNYTIIAIAHRLSTIENADRILVIDRGRLLEEGTHGDLIQSSGAYAKYHALQYGIRP